MKTMCMIVMLGLISVRVFADDGSGFGGLGGLIGTAENMLSGNVDCEATYTSVNAGVFGPETQSSTREIKDNSIGAACAEAKQGNGSQSGVFGTSSSQLTSLSCKDAHGINVNVDVDTCQAKL